MVSSIIRNFIAKRMFQQKGAIANNKSVEFSANALEQRLKNLGVDPNTIKSEGELNQILSFVKQAEDQAFNQKFGNALSGNKFQKKAEVVDLKNKKLDTEKPILGGTQETDEQILQRLKKQNKDSLNRLKNKKDPPEELAGGGVAGLLGERTGYKDGKDVFIGPKRKKKTKKELEDEKILKEKIAAYLESQTINLPEEDPLKKYQPTDYSLYGGFMDNVKMKEDRTGNIINDFNNISIDPKDARVGISRFNPKTNSSFVAGVGPSGFNINLTKQFADGGPARQNFAMGKRAFLKFMGAGAAGIAGLKTGLFGLGKKAAVKTAAPIVAEAAVVPPHFLKLVAKIKSLGDDITETGALAERQSVKKYKDYEMTTDNATGSIEIQKTKPFAEGSDNFGNGLTEDVYMSYKPGEQIIGKGGKPIKTQPEYEEGTAYLRNDGPNTGDVYEEVSGVTDDIFKEVGEEIPEAIRKGKADGGRIGYGKGDIVTKGIPALIKKIQDKFGKKAIKTVESPRSFDNYEISPDFNIKRPESAVLRDKMKNFGKPGKFNDDGTVDYDYYAEILNDAENDFVYGDETIEELESMLQKHQEYMDDMYFQYKAEGGSKRLGGPNDPMKGAIDNASPGYTGDLKYDAQLVADDLAEKMFDVEYADLTQAQQMDLYDKAYTALAKNKQGFKEMQKLSKPEKTLEGIKNTGTIDISNPDVAEEFTKFMKESDPKGFKDIEQKIQLESFDPKGRKKNATGGLAAMLGE